MGKTGSKIILLEYNEIMAEEKKSTEEQEPKEQIRQALLKKHEADKNKEEIEFLLKRL